jgi:hypothetical protein
MERRSMRRRRRRVNAFRFILALLIIAGLIAGGFFLFNKLGVNITPTQPPGATPTPTSVLAPTLSPSPGEGADPSDYGFQTGVQADGKNVSSYSRDDKISFPVASAYTALQGVTTFRGNNYRTTASYGTADVRQGKLAVAWEKNISAIRGDEIMGTGVGWTGQPLLVRWSEKMRGIMNMYPEKKQKEGLIEVIYPTLDGHIYFYDLDDGSYTRDPINLGVVIKGTASIDPRGYPLLYVGQGDTVNRGAMKYRIISLIDQEVLYELNGKDPFSHRKWTAFDSSALLDAGSDTLIEPGENGVLYTIKLNTDYDPDAGTLSIDPDPPVKYRYTANGMGEGSGKRWWGTENSMIGWRGYAFYTDNGGYLQCVDLNAMSPVWVQDVTDDSDSTMVLEEDAENQTAYLYTACQVDKQPNAKTAGRAYIRKVDALTGKVLWTKSYACSYDSHVAGGALASPILGKEGSDIEDVVIYNIAKEKEGGSLLIALDRETGDEVWTLRIRNYCWSSPVAVYDDAGKSYIVQADSAGRMLLIEGATSEVLDTIQIQQATIEGSPAVFGDRIVIGTRGQKVVCVRIK